MRTQGTSVVNPDNLFRIRRASSFIEKDKWLKAMLGI